MHETNSRNTEKKSSYQESDAMGETGQRPSVLASLRDILPPRLLMLPEALRMAELQANRLLELNGVHDAPVPTEIVSGLPRIVIAYDLDMPVSGASTWDAKRKCWVITLHATEPDTRHRITLLHEYKHIIDHGHAGLLAPLGQTYFGLTPVEYVAEYFAGCVLMPKRLVKRAWGEGVQRTEDLAELFDVSPRAIEVRLLQLGLATPLPRCMSLPDGSTYRRFIPPRRGSYHRQLSPNWPIAAVSLGVPA